MGGSNRARAVYVLVFVLATVLGFYPVLSGSFYFDDFGNLPALGEYGPVNDWAALARYLTAGIADPLGRPVAMASFLADARDWPADAQPFLRTNLLLHVVNGLLLFAVLTKLGSHVHKDAAVIARAAFFGALLWCLHPLWVSTVGYIIQRHAILATSFVLLGIFTWILSTEAFRQGARRKGWILALVAVPFFGLLAALSKANGLLLPILVLVVQVILLNGRGEQSAHERKATVFLLVVPAALLLFLLAMQIELQPEGRPWNLAERLLTQPRAIMDYLLHLVIPRVNSPGLFADGFPASSGLLSPPSTLLAAALVATVAAASLVLHHQFPAWSAAVMFYLVGHLMESTVLPLELYFEHRNYLPALLLGWALSLSLLGNLGSRVGANSILVVFSLVLAVITHQRGSLWADQWKQAIVWGETLQDSPRAQTWAAQHETDSGDLRAAEARLETAFVRFPANPMIALNLLEVHCRLGTVGVETLNRTARALAQPGTPTDVSFQWLRDQTLSGSRPCPGLGNRELSALVGAVTRRPSPSSLDSARNYRLRAYLALREGDCRAASSLLGEALEAQRRDSEAYADASILASRCGSTMALEFLDRYLNDPSPQHKGRMGMPRIHNWVLQRQGYWREELMRLQTILKKEASHPERPEGM